MTKIMTSARRMTKAKQYTCEQCKITAEGDAPFSIIRFPMPSFCSMECLELSEKIRKSTNV